MNRKGIKIFFQAIRNYDFKTIKYLLDSNSEYISVTNFSPPKKDDGQSGLQVAFKVGAFEIAELLIEKGADVNFEEKSEINEWTSPVIHDCIKATIFNCLTLEENISEFDKSLSLLKVMLEKGANPNSLDSYKNSCLNRAFLDSRQMINHPNFINSTKTLNQLRQVFRTLIDKGADEYKGNNKRESLVNQIKNYEFEGYQLI